MQEASIPLAVKVDSMLLQTDLIPQVLETALAHRRVDSIIPDTIPASLSVAEEVGGSRLMPLLCAPAIWLLPVASGFPFPCGFVFGNGVFTRSRWVSGWKLNEERICM